MIKKGLQNMPTNVKAVLVDIDDTLLDFDRSSYKAMKNCIQRLNVPFDDNMFAVFKRINKGLWKKVENGEISSRQLFDTRWGIIFDELSITADGIKFERDFTDELFWIAELVDDAEDVLSYLKSKYVVAAASNAQYAQQINRLKISGLYPYFDYLFMSEDLGVSKPSTQFFDKCVEKLNVDKGNVVMIGDSLFADIGGAKNSGISAIWFDKKNCEKQSPLPDVSINLLSEIKNIL